jgi:hypothetical protein
MPALTGHCRAIADVALPTLIPVPVPDRGTLTFEKVMLAERKIGPHSGLQLVDSTWLQKRRKIGLFECLCVTVNQTAWLIVPSFCIRIALKRKMCTASPEQISRTTYPCAATGDA